MPREEQVENLIPQSNLECSVEKSLSNPFFVLGEWPDENWWELFESSELNCLIATALEENPSIQKVQARIEIAQEEAIVIRSRLFPLVFFKAEDTWQYLSKNGLYRALNPKIPLNANLIDLTLSFSYEFDFWGKNFHLFQAALGEEAARAAEASQVQLVTTTAVAQAYFALKANLLRKHLYTKLYELRTDIFHLQELMQKKALFSKLPLLFSEENVFEAKKLLASIEEEISVDKHLINILIGRGPDCPLAIDEELPLLPQTFAIPCTLSLDLLSRRPDLMAQIWRVNALADEVGAALANFYPNINLTGFIGLESIAYSTLFQSSSKTVQLHPALSLPIFTAGAIRANVAAKKAAFDEAVFEYNNLVLRSAQEVTDLLAFAQSVFEQKEEQERILKSVRNLNKLTELRRQKGLDTLFSNYDIAEDLIQKELTNVTLLYNQYLAIIKLIKALGGGFYADFIPLEAVCK